VAALGGKAVLIDDRTPSTSSTKTPRCSATGRLSVKVVDNAGGSGPSAARYRIDGGTVRSAATKNSGNTGTATIKVPNGHHKLEYWGVDRAGNEEVKHHFATVRVDTANRCHASHPHFTG